MRAGRLDRRVTVQVRAVTQDAYGQAKETWSDLFTPWAEVIPLGGSERWAAQQTIAAEAVKFRLRFRGAFMPTAGEHRISYAGKIWDISGIAELGRREGWEITATAGVP